MTCPSAAGRNDVAGGEPTRAPRLRALLSVAALSIVLLVLLLAGGRLGGQLAGFAEQVRGLGGWAPLAFATAYAVATVAFVPGSLLSLAAGVIFGIGEGVLYVYLGATLGSAAAFLIARYVARSAVERWVASDRRFAAVDRAIGERGRGFVFLLRLSPIVPFNLLNYLLGLTRVRFGDYLLASLGMLPGILLYVYTGRVVGDLALLAAGGAAPRGGGHYALLGVGLLATLLATVMITRGARRALREATG